MVNETREFPMPLLLETGPLRMLERARAGGLVVPLQGYEVHIYGASTAGLTPQSWNALREFWRLYFREAGAHLVAYSAETNIER